MTKYEIILYRSGEDDAFIAEVPELPGCAADQRVDRHGQGTGAIHTRTQRPAVVCLKQRRQWKTLSTHSSEVER
jgi:hypothetical protein